MFTNRSAVRESMQSVFLHSPDGEVVLRFLCRHGCVTTSTFHKDERVQNMNEGKRQLVLSILRQLYSEDEMNKFVGNQFEMDSQLNSVVSEQYENT